LQESIIFVKNPDLQKLIRIRSSW